MAFSVELNFPAVLQESISLATRFAISWTPFSKKRNMSAKAFYAFPLTRFRYHLQPDRKQLYIAFQMWQLIQARNCFPPIALAFTRNVVIPAL